MSGSERRRAGFSLPELLVSLAVLLVVTVYLTDMLIRQSRAYEVVDQVTEVQQNARVIADLLDREIRTTGTMVPEGVAFCGFDDTAGPDWFYVTDTDALTMSAAGHIQYDAAADVEDPPSSSFTGGAGGVQTLRLEDVIIDGTTFAGVILDGDAAYDIDTPPDGTNDSDFQVGAGVIVFDKNNPDRGTACGTITDVTGSVVTADFTPDGVNASTLQGVAPSDEDLRAVPATAYWIDTVTDPQSPRLMRNQTLLAEDVEDLQFAVFLDFDGDGQIDLPANENPGAGAGQPVYLSRGTDHTQMREVRINFVLRGRYPDPELGTAANPGGRFQTTENRIFGGANDQFRRRVYTASVRTRNVGGRAGAGGV